MLRKVLMFNEAASKKHLDFFYGKKEAKKEDSRLSSIYRVIQCHFYNTTEGQGL